MEEEERVDFLTAVFFALTPFFLEDLDILKGKCVCFTSMDCLSKAEWKIINNVRDGSIVHDRGGYL